MLTLLPHIDYEQTAKVLLDRDLETSMLHAKIVLDCLHEVDDAAVRAWRHHPATAMWKGFEVQLCMYGLTLGGEYTRRLPTEDNPLINRLQWHFETATMPDDFKMEKPPWMQDPFKSREVERTHRSVLVGRKIEYKKLWPEVQAGMTPYQPAANEE